MCDCATLAGVTDLDTPPSPEQHEPTFRLADMAPRRPRRVSPLVIAVAGLGLVVVIMAAVIVAILAGDRNASPTSATASSASTAAPPTPGNTAPYSPPPATKEVQVPFGETLTLSGSSSEVHYTVNADKTYTKTKYGTKPEKGILYGVKVLVEVIEGSTYACACDFALIATDGTAYEGSGYQVSGGLDAVDLNRGQKAAGVVVFDIPQGAQASARIELREGSNNQGFWTAP